VMAPMVRRVGVFTMQQCRWRASAALAVLAPRAVRLCEGATAVEKSFLTCPNNGVTSVKGIGAHSDNHSRGVDVICETLLRFKKERQLGCYGFVPEDRVSWQPVRRVR